MDCFWGEYNREIRGAVFESSILKNGYLHKMMQGRFIKFMEVKFMSDYEEYKLEWMIDHGYTLGDLMSELTAYQNSLSKDVIIPVSKLFEEWEKAIGFGSSIWACEEEWTKHQRTGEVNELLYQG